MEKVEVVGCFDELDKWYLEGLRLFKVRIETAIDNRGDVREFREILAWGFRSFGLEAAQMHRDLDISKAAISKWTNGLAGTTVPTQRAALEWVLGKIEVQIDELSPSRAFTI
jgi:hypothetical protein